MNKHVLNFNAPAPDLELVDLDGNPVRLSNLWSQQPVLLAFTRHFGCTQCKEMLDELVQNKTEIEKAGLLIVAITQGTPETALDFARRYAPGLMVLVDPQRKAYKAYGLKSGNILQLFLHPRIWGAIARARKKGFRIEIPPRGQSARQMSGAFIIGKNGRIELPYYYDHIADHAALDLFLSGVLSTGWNKPFDGPLGPRNDRG